MTDPPLDNPDRIAPLRGRWRAAATWLACVALLGKFVLPAVLSIIFGLTEPGRDTSRVGLCGGPPGDASGKTKPAPLAQHCPLCTAPVSPLPRPPGIANPGEVADRGQLQLRTTLTVASIRHGRMQARAPPSVV